MVALVASARALLARWPRLAPGVAVICLVVALSSAATGIVAPTYPLHARALGFDLATIGRIPLLAGIASLCLAPPIGLLSDRIG